MTQQNAALVEQAAAAAQSLREQASDLAQVVSIFRLIDDKPDQTEPGNATAKRRDGATFALLH